jgi:hypothetical protein
MSEPNSADPRPERDEARAIARRKLLQQARYVPPAILAMLFVDLKSAAAASCGPDRCNPGGGCGPTNCRPFR